MLAHEPQTVIVGDVHGCLTELDALLRKVRFTKGDRLVLVGDLVAKGPDSAGVVARARELGALAVRGNHDERVLSWFRADREGRSLDRPLGRGHRLVCATLDDQDVAWLEALPLSLRFPEHKVTVVHAGLRPGVPLAKQDPTHLLNMRSLCGDGRVSFRADEGVPWASRWTGPDLVVFGHDAIRGLQRYEQAIGLDTGCVYGGQLTALLLPSRRLVSVNARRAYKEIRVSTRPDVDLWRLVCARADLRPGALRQVALGRNELGIPVSVLVGVSRDGDLYAYENLCKHLPIPLDGGSGDFFAGDPDTLRCGTHGALYRVSDGFCTRGPCRGTFLRRHTLREQDGDVWLRVG